MKVGWHLPCSVTEFSPQSMLAAAREAEDAGYDSLWANEHIVVPARIESRYPFSDDGRLHADPTSPYAEPLSTLAFVAALRHPLLMAKTTATVDALSGGRLIVGLGAGWLREEFAALDVPFDRRARMFDEHLEFLRKAWQGGGHLPLRRRVRPLGRWGWSRARALPTARRSGSEPVRRRSP